MTRYAFLLAGWMVLGGTGWAQAKEPSRAYQELYQKAAQAFAQEKFDEAFTILDQADQVEPGVSHGHNLRGAIYTKQRKFPEAEASFRKTLEMDPNMNLAYFNLGEVSFLQKNYPEAKKRFQTFLEKNGENDLGQFKIFLCDLVGGNADAAKKVGRSFPLSASTPLRYYALAAIAFSEENEAEAIEYIRSAASIYPLGQNNAFADSFIELGWLKRLEQENFGLQDSPVISESVLRPTTSGPAGEEVKAPSFEGLLPSGEKK